MKLEYWQLIFWDIDTDILFYILRYWIFDFHDLLALIKKKLNKKKFFFTCNASRIYESL